MSIVCISPHFPLHYTAFCTQLKAAGATVLGVADAPYENLKLPFERHSQSIIAWTIGTTMISSFRDDGWIVQLKMTE